MFVGIIVVHFGQCGVEETEAVELDWFLVVPLTTATSVK